MAPCKLVGSATVEAAAPCIVPYVSSISSHDGTLEFAGKLSSAAYARVEYASEVTIVLKDNSETLVLDEKRQKSTQLLTHQNLEKGTTLQVAQRCQSNFGQVRSKREELRTAEQAVTYSTRLLRVQYSIAKVREVLCPTFAILPLIHPLANRFL